MVIRNVTVNDCTPETIVIGRRGTFETMQVVFDLTYLIENYGDGTAVLALKRSQDSSAYPAVAAQDGNTLTWVVREVDTYYVGAGVCQLMWYVDDGLAKTIIYPMVVMKDILSTAEEPPDGYENWIEQLTELGAETLQNAQNASQSASEAEQAKDDAVDAKEASEEAARKAEAASVHAPVIYGGYWYIWNNGQYVNTGVRAEGQKGDQGDPGVKGDTGNGIASITKTGTSGLVDTYTVTYTDGTTTTFTVTNGAKGDKGDTGATGNGIQSITKTGTSGNVDTYTITYTNGQTTTFTVTNGGVSSVAGKTGEVTLNANDIAFSESGTYDEGTVGAELSDQKNAIGELNHQLSDVEDELHPIATKTLHYTDITWSRGYLKSDGTTVDNTSYMVSAYLPVSAGDSVVYDGLRSSSSIYPCLCGYDSSKNFVSGSGVAGDGTVSQSGTYTVPNGVSFIRVSTYDYDGTIRFNSITMPVAGDRLDGFDDELEVVDDRLDAIESAIPMYQYTLGFNDFEYTTGKVASKEGETTRADGQVTDYISTANMLSVSATTVRMPVMTTGKLVAVIGCYDSSKNLLESKSVFATGTYGQFVNVTGSVTITSDISYIRLSRLSGSADTSIFVVTKERTLAADYDVTKAEVADIEERIDSVWKGKKWYAFGTSLTDDRYLDPNGDPTGKYPDILNQWMKANLVNCGQGGGSITNYNSLIMNKINNTDFSDADIVTLEGFPNDYAMPIGDLLDTTMDTLAGAIYTAVTKIYEVAPNATVVLITASQGQMNEQGTAGYPIWFSDGKQLKFNEMTIRMAHYLGCHVIDAGGKAQINNFHPEYLVDHIHHSWAGGWQYAATIWEEMKLIHPNTNNPYLEEEEES